MASTKEVPSLRQLATKAVTRQFVNAKGVVALMKCFEEIDWMIVEGPELKQKCIQFISTAYRCMKVHHSPEELEQLIGKETVRRKESELKQLSKDIKKIKVQGSVLERSSWSRSLSADIEKRTPKLTRSVSGKTAYPLESLQAGRVWPPGVNPTRREEHLDINEFQAVFRVSYDTYRSYPTWKRAQIKKEKKLF